MKTDVSAGLDLAFDDAQLAVADAVRLFCSERLPDDLGRGLGSDFPPELWRELGELGVLALATPEGEGGALELVAALEALGAAGFPGPLAATCFAAQLLPEPERHGLVSGELLVSVGTPPLLPWAPLAGCFVELADGRAFRAQPRGAIEPVETLGGEPWGRVALERGEELAGAPRAFVLFDVALSAYLAAAGARLVEDTAEHARTRKQFGRAIGEFQAVAHPLADGFMQLAAAQTLARTAAFHFDRGAPGAADAARYAAAARLAARRCGVEAAHTCHQLFGAVGITLEGPVFRISRRLRQLASLPPDASHARELLLERLGL